MFWKKGGGGEICCDVSLTMLFKHNTCVVSNKRTEPQEYNRKEEKFGILDKQMEMSEQATVWSLTESRSDPAQ
jgi:hypothetical protein